MPINLVAFGKAIKADRERLGMNQTKYAIHVGLSKSQQSKISLLEAGKMTQPTYETVQKLKRQLGMMLLPGEDGETTGSANIQEPTARPPTPALAVLDERLQARRSSKPFTRKRRQARKKG